MTLKEAAENIGHKVVYTPYPGCPTTILEEGVISSVNDEYVFVRYSLGDTAAATNPEDLELSWKG